MNAQMWKPYFGNTNVDWMLQTNYMNYVTHISPK